MDRLSESERVELYTEWKQLPPFEGCKVFLRAFFRDEDIDVVQVCNVCAKFEDFITAKGISGYSPNTVDAVKFFQELGHPITVQALKGHMKEFDNIGETMSFVDFSLIYWEKSVNLLFERDVDGIPELLAERRVERDKALDVEDKIRKCRKRIEELEAVKGAKIFEAKQEMEKIMHEELEPLARELDMAWAIVEEIQDRVDEEGSQLDLLLMDLGLHDMHLNLFAVL